MVSRGNRWEAETGWKVLSSKLNRRDVDCRILMHHVNSLTRLDMQRGVKNNI